MIKTLEWDTNFFGYKVGESYDVPDEKESAAQGYRLIYIKSKKRLGLNYFFDHKVTFSKKTQPHDKLPEEMKSILGVELNDQLIKLALISGEHSRFKLDPNFKSKEFEKLYTEWIKKSLNGQLAEEVYTYGNEGFVTVRLKGNDAQIGLIAVSPTAQGKGVGKKLLTAAEKFAYDHGASTLYVPTQGSNAIACRFYESFGFTLFSEEFLYHQWIK